jgi:hypothetical protein
MTEQSLLAYCKEFFEIRECGNLYWVKKPHPKASSVRIGGRAGAIDQDGYLFIKISGRFYKAHRLIWLIHHGRWPSDQIDHIDRDKQNNRIENLREVTCAQNHQNQSIQKNNTSGSTGVYFRKRHVTNPWQASIFKDGKFIFRRGFPTREEAVAAREAAEREHFTHSQLNTK